MLANGFQGVSPNFLTQFYNQPGQVVQPGLENVMTPQQFADAQALNQLTGQSAIGVPQQLGKQFQAPTTYGSFQNQNALQGLYDQLKANESVLPQMSPTQQQAWLGDIQQLGSWLGIPNTNYPNPTPPTPTPPAPTPPDPMHPIYNPDPNDPNGGTWLGFV
jgi:hypothetical protein